VKPHFTVLGVRIDAVQLPEVIAQMESWIQARNGSHWVEPAGMHGLSETLRNPTFRMVLNDADLVVADGMPLVWLGRRKGFALKRRVYGPELLESFCRWTGAEYRHFFYGGAPGVADRLASALGKRYGIRTAGTHSPPFRPLTAEEDQAIVRKIRAASPDVLWVGLGMPEKERWMCEHRDVLGVPVMVGAGAAFDIVSGRLHQAPRWMQEHGMEWLFRLLQEPRRLWHRYLVLGPQFAWYSALEALGLKRFD
jgi:N-acetylglucosaminyldiphosphoundecaprenol N-acetyl-beta-D-mannosaminyltransferase